MSELPASWTTVMLCDVGTAITGNTPPTSNQSNYGQDVPFIKPPDLENRVIESPQTFLSNEGATISRTLPPLAVLVTCIGNLGRVGISRTRVAFNQQINAVVPSAALDPFFLFYVAQSHAFRTQLESKASATTISIVNKGNFERISVPLPPLAEQKRIVAKIEELFSELEAGEESLRVARRQLGVYRQSLLKQAFAGHLTAKWRSQNRSKLGEPLTASTNLDEEPGPLPAGWIWQTINEVADVTGGLTKNSKRDSLPLRIPYLRVANVYANELRLDEIKDIGVTAAEANKVCLVKGDLLIVEGNGSLDQIGRVAAWNGSISDCGHQNHLIRARCHPNAHYAFVLMFLLSPHGRDVIEKHAASTSGLHTLSVSKVQRLPVPLCSLAEQQEIVRLLDEQFEVIDQNEREIDEALRKSEALRQAILKKAFTGRLVPQDPADEPATQLLARLRAARSGTSSSSPSSSSSSSSSPSPSTSPSSASKPSDGRSRRRRASVDHA